MRLLLFIVLGLISVFPAEAQQEIDDPYVVATVSRAPFSMIENGQDTGFSLDLWDAVATELRLPYEVRRFSTFPEMLDAVENGDVDLAVANISITAERETRMDFSQPIFSAGIQVMLPPDASSFALISAALSPRLVMMVLGFAALLLLLGMIMWILERRTKTFGDTASQAAFPAFWWALNILTTGDYKEDAPQTFLGRIFGTAMVVGSLFVVSLFVATLTANITLDALERDVKRITDLDGRKVGTTENSTASVYLDSRGVAHQSYLDLDALFDAFRKAEIEAVVFDGPVLAYFVQTEGPGVARLVDRVFQSDNYGIALPSGSEMREPINRILLRFEEDGTYAELQQKYFGGVYSQD
jgi:polar amino acid transport system substrate-binding protein